MPTDPSRAPLVEDRTAGGTALLVVDMFSAWDFPDADRLAPAAAAIAPRIAALRRRCARAGVSVVFVNDNAGRWRSDAPGLLARAARSGPVGAEIARHLDPGERDYFVLKPKHSAFFETPLDLLLRSLRARRIVLAGVAAEHCIEQTALEARMRDYEVVVARDAVAGVSARAAAAALERLETAHEVTVRAASRIRLPRR